MTGMTSTRQRNIGALVGLLALSAVVAGTSAAVTLQNVRTWYPILIKPSFNPPNWLFGPVWTLLYIAMAVAAWRVWRLRRGSDVNGAVGLYLVQMALNFAWSLIFFGAHRIGAALLDIAGLLVLLAATLVMFWRRDAIAGLLLAPYLAWVAFAAALNFAIWRLN
jgi:tryptophan-rich sensory protein